MGSKEVAMKISVGSGKVFLLLFALILIYQMFIPPIVGLADNGDFSRIMNKVGIQVGDGKEYMGNINLQFPISFHYDTGGYQSSELIFVVTSIFLNSIVSKDGLFHLLSLGIVHLIALLAAIAVVAYGVSQSKIRSKWVVLACILIFFTDVGYVSYMNSIYSEPATLIFLTLTIGIVLLIAIQVNNQSVSIGWALFYFVTAFLFVIAKPQNAAMGIPLALLGYWLMRHVRPPKVIEKWRTQIVLVLSIGLVVGSFLLFAFGLPNYYRSGDLWNSVFLEIIGTSQNPEQDLRELGLPPEMIIYKGKYAFAEGVNRNAYEEFQHSWLYFRIFKFYLLHPGRLFSLMDSSTSQAFELQQSNLGNFVSSEAFGSYDKSQAFTFWNKLRMAVLPKSIWTLVGLFVINLGTVWVRIKKFDHSKSSLLLSELHLTIIFMAVFQYLTVLMAEGTFELVKHMFLFNLLIDITFVFLIAYLVEALRLVFNRTRKNYQLIQ